MVTSLSATDLKPEPISLAVRARIEDAIRLFGDQVPSPEHTEPSLHPEPKRWMGD